MAKRQHGSEASDPGPTDQELEQQETVGEPLATSVPIGPTTTNAPSALPCEVVELRVDEIMPDPLNPNEQSADKFNTLVSTISEDGFDQPIVVCPLSAQERALLQAPPEVKYVIAKGEHRWRSARVLGHQMIPVVLRPWDELTRRTRMVRDNVVKGDLNREKFTELVHSLQHQHRLDAELTASMIGMDSAKEMFGHMVREQQKKGLEDQTHVDHSKDALKVLDDLSLLLNSIFTKYGHTLPYGFITFMWAGKIHTMVEMQEELKVQIEELGRVATERKVDFNLLLAALLKDTLPTVRPVWEVPPADTEKNETV